MSVVVVTWVMVDTMVDVDTATVVLVGPAVPDIVVVSVNVVGIVDVWVCVETTVVDSVVVVVIV